MKKSVTLSGERIQRCLVTFQKWPSRYCADNGYRRLRKPLVHVAKRSQLLRSNSGDDLSGCPTLGMTSLDVRHWGCHPARDPARDPAKAGCPRLATASDAAKHHGKAVASRRSAVTGVHPYRYPCTIPRTPCHTTHPGYRAPTRHRPYRTSQHHRIRLHHA